MARHRRQRSRVQVTKGQFHMCSSWMVETPRKMKMSVSLTLLHIFRKYLMVVCDFSEMLASTYCFMLTAHVMILCMQARKQNTEYNKETGNPAAYFCDVMLKMSDV